MKKNCVKLLLMAGICMLFVHVNAQKSFLTFSAGYGLKTSTQNLPDLFMYNFTSDQTGFTTREQINLSLGNGLAAEGSYGYMFMKNIGAELAVSYLAGGKTDSRFSYTAGNIDYSVSAGMLRLVPSIIIRGNSGKTVPYGKFGLVTGFGTITLNENSNLSEVKEVRTTVYKKGMAVGLTAGLGLITRISDAISLITELNTVNMSYAPGMSEVSDYTVNGENKMSSLTESERKTEFYDSIKLKVIDTDKPRPALKQKLPFGSIGLKMGLQINL